MKFFFSFFIFFFFFQALRDASCRDPVEGGKWLMLGGLFGVLSPGSNLGERGGAEVAAFKLGAERSCFLCCCTAFTFFAFCLCVRLAGVPVLRALQHLGPGHGLPNPAHGRRPGPDLCGLQGPRPLHGHQQCHGWNAQGWQHNLSLSCLSVCIDPLSQQSRSLLLLHNSFYLFRKQAMIICKLVLFFRCHPR